MRIVGNFYGSDHVLQQDSSGGGEGSYDGRHEKTDLKVFVVVMCTIVPY